MRVLNRAKIENFPMPSLSQAEEGLLSAVILTTASLIRRSGNMTYRTQLGLAPIEWVIIAQLGRRGPMTQTQIIDRFAFDKGQMSRATAALVRNRLITREGRASSSSELHLTPKGTKMYARIEQLIRTRNSSLGTGLSSRELRAFFQTLGRIASNAERLLERVKSKPDEGP